MSRPPIAFISELDDSVFHGDELLGYSDSYWTGRFFGHVEHERSMGPWFEDLSLAEAVAWAREHAERAVIRIESDEYGIGDVGRDIPPWPQDGLPEPVRRRWKGERWKDRTDADPDASWTVELSLGPPGEPFDARLPEWDAEVARIAERLGTTWSTATIDGFLADLRRAAKAAKGEEFGWTTHHARCYVVPVAVRAPTAQRAQAAGAALVPALPEGWELGTSVRFDG